MGLFEKKLQAEAVVLEDEGHGKMMEKDSHGVDWDWHKFVLEVRPTGEEPFRVETKAKVAWFHEPKQGDVVRVEYESRSHKTELQIEGDPRYDPKMRRAAEKEQKHAEKQRAQALLKGENPQQEGKQADHQMEAFAKEMVRLGDHPRWRVPPFCPQCGAPVDQATASHADRPTCEYCHDPLPATSLGLSD